MARLSKMIPWVIVLAVAAAVGVARWRSAPVPVAVPAAAPSMIGAARGPASTAEGLDERVAQMEARIAGNPEDSAARLVLAEALLRQARVTGNAAAAARAEQEVRRALRDDPGSYEGQRMLGVVLLSLHRFDEAIVVAERARTIRPDDAFPHGIIGDGQLELGRYDEAFTAFQQMMDLRPSAASYARASYALELQGDLEGALGAMRRAANATSPRDAEGLAWTLAHVGDLLVRLDRLPEADTEYRIALRAFPDHPFARLGLARVAAARDRDDDALALVMPLVERAPSIGLAAFAGDLHARNGRQAEAERLYALAETIGRDARGSDESLGGFLAERGRRIEDAVGLAEEAAAARQDIRSQDALAWAYARAGRLDDAHAAAARALRTGTRDRRIVMHASAIEALRGNQAAAHALARRAAPREPDFDILVGREVLRLATAPASAGGHTRLASTNR